jgi:hypothetical protein
MTNQQPPPSGSFEPTQQFPVQGQQDPQQAPPPNGGQPYPGQPAATPPTNNSNTVIAVLLAIVTMLLIFALVFFLFLRDSSDGNADNGASSTTSMSAASTVPSVTTVPGATTVPVNPATTAAAAPAAAPALASTVAPAAPPATLDPCVETGNVFLTGLTVDDPEVTAKVESPGWVRSFQMQVDAGDRLRVFVRQVDFPVGVKVSDSSGVSLGSNFPQGGNAELIVQVQVSGLHNVEVFADSGCGEFGVFVEDLGLLSAQSGGSFFVQVPARPMQAFESVDLLAGDTLVAQLLDAGSGTDPFLTLLDPRGIAVSTDDDSAGGLDARISTVVSVAGTYQIVYESVNGVAGPAELGIFIN